MDTGLWTKQSESMTELKDLVGKLRVSELQSLLSFAGRNKNGRKSELLQRAEDLVSSNCPSAIVFKLYQLVRRRFPDEILHHKLGPVTRSNSSTSANAEPDPNPTVPTANTSNTERDTNMSANSAPTGTAAVGQSGENSDESTASYVYPDGPSPAYYNSVVGSSGPSADRPSSSVPIMSLTPLQPDVQMKPLPYYDLIDVLLRPSSLSAVGAAADNHYNRASFTFCLTPSQSTEILHSQSDIMGSDCGIVEYGVQIQLRFALLETTSSQADNFPTHLVVRVNHQELQLPSLIPSNKIGVEPKRTSCPLNITPLSKLSAVEQNKVVVYWSINQTQHHCVGVYLVRQLTSTILLGRLRQHAILHQDHTRALIKEKLRQNVDNEISTTSLRISLLCPLSKQRMQVPCRPRSCHHLQCFDALSFLQMNEKKSTWMCPVCNKPAEYSDLVIDSLFSEILDSSDGFQDIEFSASGQWSPVQPRQSTSYRPVSLDNSALVIDTTQEESPSTSNHAKRNIELIDLTESDDNDDGDNNSVCALSSSESTSSSSTRSLIGFPSLRKKFARPISTSSMSSASPSHSQCADADDDSLSTSSDIIHLD